MSDALERPCVLCRRREAAPGLLLCSPDRDRLGSHLDPGNRGRPFNPDEPSAPVRPASIPVLYRELADLEPDLGERAHEHATTASLNPYPMALRDTRSKATGPGPDDDGVSAPRSVVATLGGWARIVHEEHVDLEGRPDPLPRLAAQPWIDVRMPYPTSDPDRAAPWRDVRRYDPETRPDVQAVDTLCRWLQVRADWIATQTWVDDLIADLRTLTAQLRAGTGDIGSRPLGPCPATVNDAGELDPASDHTCGQPLYMPALAPRGLDARLAPPSVRCAACGARWEGLELLDFGRHINGGTPLA